MINPELLQILCCPETHQPVALADAQLLGELNRAIRLGQVRNRGERLLNEPLAGALVRADAKVIYPIRNGIPVLLVDEGIVFAANRP